MALTENRELERYMDQELRALPVKGGAHVYKGAFVGLIDGYARALVEGDPFAGIAYEESDNSEGGADLFVRVYTMGDFDHPLAGATRERNGENLYAMGDDALNYAPRNSTFPSRVGRQIDVYAPGRIVLRIKSCFDR